MNQHVSARLWPSNYFTLKSCIFWDVTLCSPAWVCQYFRWTHCLHLHRQRANQASRALLYSCHIPEDGMLHGQCCENFKSDILYITHFRTINLASSVILLWLLWHQRLRSPLSSFRIKYIYSFCLGLFQQQFWLQVSGPIQTWADLRIFLIFEYLSLLSSGVTEKSVMSESKWDKCITKFSLLKAPN
jgi:hypothetical protein